jgi:hypothetical protein
LDGKGEFDPTTLIRLAKHRGEEAFFFLNRLRLIQPKKAEDLLPWVEHRGAGGACPLVLAHPLGLWKKGKAIPPDVEFFEVLLRGLRSQKRGCLVLDEPGSSDTLFLKGRLAQNAVQCVSLDHSKGNWKLLEQTKIQNPRGRDALWN